MSPRPEGEASPSGVCQCPSGQGHAIGLCGLLAFCWPAQRKGCIPGSQFGVCLLCLTPVGAEPAQGDCCCLVAKSCPTLCEPLELEPARLPCPWAFPGKNTGVGYVCMSFSRGSSQARDPTHVSCIGRWILYHRATWEAPHGGVLYSNSHRGAQCLVEAPPDWALSRAGHGGRSRWAVQVGVVPPFMFGSTRCPP